MKMLIAIFKFSYGSAFGIFSVHRFIVELWTTVRVSFILIGDIINIGQVLFCIQNTGKIIELMNDIFQLLRSKLL